MCSLRCRIRLFPLAILLFFSSCSKKVLTDARDAHRKEISGSLKQRYSDLLNISEKEITNDKLYKFIDGWIGVQPRDGGMDKRGVDCSGFTVLLEKEIYNRNLPRVASQMAGVVKRKYEGELREGDLVFFDFNGQRFSHVGVYLANHKFVHASSSRGVIISDLTDLWYYKYFSRAGAVAE